jgi:hypothetical protein
MFERILDVFLWIDQVLEFFDNCQTVLQIGLQIGLKALEVDIFLVTVLQIQLVEFGFEWKMIMEILCSVRVFGMKLILFSSMKWWYLARNAFLISSTWSLNAMTFSVSTIFSNAMTSSSIASAS